MKIVENFIMSKTGNIDVCEDGLFISDDFVAVIDGATSKSAFQWPNGATSGRYAKDVIMNAMNQLKRDATANEAIEYLSQQLAKEYLHDVAIPLQDISSNLEASIIIYSTYRQEVWRYGDCLLRINQRNRTNEKEIDIIAKKARSAFLQATILGGKANYNQLLENDLGRDFIFPLLQIQSIFANSDGIYGYPVLSSHHRVNARYIEVYKVKKSDSIIMASDGYPKLFTTLCKSEKWLAYIIKNDPLLIKTYLSTKGLCKGNVSYDDRCFIKLIV